MQFGRALPRLITHIVNAPPEQGPVYLSKFDVDDGFYRIHLNTQDIPLLAVAFINSNNQPMVAFPLVLPMGWAESPPLFCAVSETITDIANANASKPITIPLLIDWNIIARMRNLTITIRIPPKGLQSLMSMLMILLQWPRAPQNGDSKCDAPCSIPWMKYSGHCNPTEAAWRKEPLSIKKLQKGDGNWSTSKQILGWDIDTIAGTHHSTNTSL